MEDAGDAARVGHEPQMANLRYRQGCSYSDFVKCGPPNFNGRGGATECVQWLEKIEAVISRSNCTYDTRINYVTGSFSHEALSWWNSEVDARS